MIVKHAYNGTLHTPMNSRLSKTRPGYTRFSQFSLPDNVSLQIYVNHNKTDMEWIFSKGSDTEQGKGPKTKITMDFPYKITRTRPKGSRLKIMTGSDKAVYHTLKGGGVVNVYEIHKIQPPGTLHRTFPAKTVHQRILVTHDGKDVLVEFPGHTVYLPDHRVTHENDGTVVISRT